MQVDTDITLITDDYPSLTGRVELRHALRAKFNKRSLHASASHVRVFLL